MGVSLSGELIVLFDYFHSHPVCWCLDFAVCQQLQTIQEAFRNCRKVLSYNHFPFKFWPISTSRSSNSVPGFTGFNELLAVFRVFQNFSRTSTEGKLHKWSFMPIVMADQAVNTAAF